MIGSVVYSTCLQLIMLAYSLYTHEDINMGMKQDGFAGDAGDWHSAGGKARAEALSSEKRSSITSEGGAARANKLSPERRSDIASSGGIAKAEGK